jgi:uncharacterized delta-60 repeat protein
MYSEDLDITLRVKNNKPYPQEINIMGSPINLLDNSNATREFLWNITSENIESQPTLNISLEYKSNGALAYDTYTFSYNNNSGILDVVLQDLSSLLNNLGIGSFNCYTQGGQVYINTFNDYYEFNILTLNNTTFAGQIAFPAQGTGFNGIIYTNSIAVQSNGKILVGGSFTSYNSNPCNYIARLNSDGTFDNTFNSTIPFNTVLAFTILSDDKILISEFPASLYKLDQDGNLDIAFTAAAFNNVGVVDIQVQTDGKIIAGGDFTACNFNPMSSICRLNSDGTFDNTFTIGSGFVNAVSTLQLQSDGKIIVGGNFTTYNGNPCNYICRLNSDGTFDNTFIIGSGFDNLVNTLQLQSDGKILVGGSFTSYNSNPCNYICRLNSDGTFDNTFNGGSNGTILDIAIQDNGKILIGGLFTTYNGNPSVSIARLNSDGTFDNTFISGTGFDANINKLTLYNNLIYAGGAFSTYNGTPTNSFAALYNQSPY